MHGDQSLGETKGGSQEDGYDFTDVGRDQVTDELLHVVVDGTTCEPMAWLGTREIEEGGNRLYFGDVSLDISKSRPMLRKRA